MNKNRRRLAVLAALMFGLCCAAGAQNFSGRSALFRAASTNDAAELRRLIDSGAVTNGPSFYSGIMEDALCEAAANNAVDAAKILIEAGADVNKKESSGNKRTALMAAAEWSSTDVARLLIAAGADLNEKDRDGWTARTYARLYFATEIEEMLKAAGAQP